MELYILHWNCGNIAEGWKNGHSFFKLPILLNEASCCKVKSKSDDAKLLKNAKLIIWDEIKMTHNHEIHSADKYFQDLMIGGDFRQCLPVFKRDAIQHEGMFKK